MRPGQLGYLLQQYVLAHGALQRVGLQFGVDPGVCQVVGVIAQTGQGHAQHHFQCLLLGVTGIEEGPQIGIGHTALVGDHGLGEQRQRVEPGIIQGLGMAQGLDGLGRQQLLQRGELGMPGYAEATAD